MFIPYASQWIDDDDIKSVENTLRSELITQGSKVKEFEEKVADYCGSKFAVAVNSGTSALHISCLAAGIGSNDEVITSPITFVATSNSILYCGAKPVFADIRDDTVNIDPREIENNITSKTKAVIPVHFAGHPCDMTQIRSIAKKHNLIVIDDACHALGSEYKKIKTGSCSFSDLTVISFHAVKHITTGEGGMVLTNDDKLYQKLILLRTHGISRDKKILKDNRKGPWYYEMHYLGFNYRLTDFQCALGLKQLEKSDKFLSRRRKIVSLYKDGFKSLINIKLPVELANVKSSWHLYCIRVSRNRDKIFKSLRDKGIGVNVHYIPVYKHPYYQSIGYRNVSCQSAEKYYSQTITLPLYPKMSDRDADFVIKAVKETIHELG